MSEIELGEVTVKVLLAHVLVDAIDAALEDREEVLGGIGRSITPYIFISRVMNGAMAGKPLADWD